MAKTSYGMSPLGSASVKMNSNDFTFEYLHMVCQKNPFEMYVCSLWSYVLCFLVLALNIFFRFAPNLSMRKHLKFILKCKSGLDIDI